MRKHMIVAKIACSLIALIGLCASAFATNSEIKEYGIVLLLQDDFIKQVVTLNKQIAEKLPDLENTKNIWHITLYHGAFSQADLDLIYNKLQKLKLESLVLDPTNLYVVADRWVGWGIEKNPKLQALHTTVVGLASPYHKRPLQRVSDVYNTLPAERRKQVDEYGVMGILDLYAPQVTIFYQYPPNERLKDVVKELAPPSNMKRTVAKLVIGELGYNGNITKVIHSIALPANLE